MFEIKLNIGGVEKTFSKKYINVEDNLLALEHQVRQMALYSDEKKQLDPKQHRNLNEAYLTMFVKMFGNQFNVSDLKQADVSILKVLNELYKESLGGEKESEEEESEKKE